MIPILYESGFISIQTLWIFSVLAVLVASYLAVERLKRARVNFTLLIGHSTSLLIWSLIGARMVYFIMHPDIYLPGFDQRTFFNFFSIWDQGFSLWGAVIFMSIALVRILNRAEENLGKWADALIVPLLVGLCVGCIGAFLGGYSYGEPTNLPWGVLYESFNVKYTVPVHPVQLYELLLIAGLLGGKRSIEKKSSFFQKEGNAFLYFAASYSFIAFILEFLRGDDTLLILGVRVPQIGFFFLTALFSTLLWKRLKHQKHGSDQTL